MRLSSPILLLALTLFSGLARAGDDDDRDREKLAAPAPAMMEMDFDGFSVSPGGAEDITFFRDRVAAGEIPHPNVFTPEGLFSEHDLPIAGSRACDRLICPIGRAVSASLLVQPEVRWIAQLGFDSGLDPATWHRAPLNLVAVIDKSGSMDGTPLETVKASLREVVKQLGPQDQLAVILYGDTVAVHLPPTSGGDPKALLAGIDAIRSAGSTDMESGLKAGFELAESTAKRFDGTTRVMLFTDERPNVGRTDAESFMAMAEAASRDHIGLTTIGVGEQFGAELATKISSVRGGNLHFFGDLGGMRKVFAEELDTMVTEVAYDMELVVKPAPGVKIAGVYGIPGDAMQWEKDGSMRMVVPTLFLSRKDGAIYFAFASAGSDALPATTLRDGASVATIHVDYTSRDGRHEPSDVPMGLAPLATAGKGLERGVLLIDEVTALKQATALHHEHNDQEGAYRIVHTLASELAANADPELQNERDLVFRLEGTLAHLSGHQGETRAVAGRDPVSGLPLVGARLAP